MTKLKSLTIGASTHSDWSFLNFLTSLEVVVIRNGDGESWEHARSNPWLHVSQLKNLRTIFCKASIDTSQMKSLLDNSPVEDLQAGTLSIGEQGLEFLKNAQQLEHLGLEVEVSPDQILSWREIAAQIGETPRLETFRLTVELLDDEVVAGLELIPMQIGLYCTRIEISKEAADQLTKTKVANIKVAIRPSGEQLSQLQAFQELINERRRAAGWPERGLLEITQ